MQIETNALIRSVSERSKRSKRSKPLQPGVKVQSSKWPQCRSERPTANFTLVRSAGFIERLLPVDRVTPARALVRNGEGRMKNLVLGGVAAMTVAGAAHASDWRLMAYNQTFVTALEREGLQSHGEVRNGWVAYGLPSAAEGMDYFVTRYEWDCLQETSRAIHTVAYLDSEAIYEEAGTSGAKVVVPDTDEAIVLRAACDGVDPAPNHAGWRSVTDLVQNYRDTLPPT